MSEANRQTAWDIPMASGRPTLDDGPLLSFEEQFSGSANAFPWMRGDHTPAHSPVVFGMSRNSTGTSELSCLQAHDKSGNGKVDDKDQTFREIHAERNKQAQRRFRKRQKERIQELMDKLAALKAEKCDLEQRQSLLEQACQMRDEELKKVREIQKEKMNDQEEEELARRFQGAVTLTFKEQEPITLTPKQIKQMSEQELARFWSTYVKELAVLLVSVEGNEEPAPDVMDRIRDLVQNELLSLYIRAALTNMQSVKKFIAHAKIEEVRMTANSIDSPNRWKQVSQALQLSDEQGQRVTEMWQMFVSSVGKIADERRGIHALFHECIHSANSGLSCAQTYLSAYEHMDALKKSLRAEHVQIHDFLMTFFLQGLTVIQMARCFVRSFPFYPDIPAIAAWVAASNKNPLALSKMSSLECPSPAISA